MTKILFCLMALLNMSPTYASRKLPIIDISPLLNSSYSITTSDKVDAEIGRACEDPGFFYIVGHGVSEELQEVLMAASKSFFKLSLEQKNLISMKKGGKAWRGYFSVGEEFTR